MIQAAHHPIEREWQQGSLQANRWDQLPVPSLDDFEPHKSVCCILPYYNQTEQLHKTLSALCMQRYPVNLLEVIVSDDGSSQPTLSYLYKEYLRIRTVRQADLGYRLAAARNLGAHEASSDILVFLDSDMVPDPLFIAAHARWHHIIDYAVTLGQRTHVSFEGIDSASVASHAQSGSLDELLASRSRERPEYIHQHLARTKDLTTRHDDLFRIVTGGNLGLRADTFQQVGGFDESFTKWGCEDIEFGYRLFNDGAVLIPEPAAHCWHQGLGHIHDPGTEAVLEQQRAKLAHLVPHRGFRHSHSGRSYLVPRVVVTVRLGEETKEQIAGVVDSILAGQFHDLVVRLDSALTRSDSGWIEESFNPDPRVVVAPSQDDEQRLARAAIQVSLPAACVLTASAIGDVVARMEQVQDPIGLLTLATSLENGQVCQSYAVTTRALRRGQRVVPESDPFPEVGRQFGEWWASGEEFGFTPYTPRNTQISEKAAQPRASPGRAPADEADFARAVIARFSPRQLEILVSLAHKGVRTLTAIDDFRRADSIRSRLVSLRAAGAVWTPMPIRRSLYRYVYPFLRRLNRGSR